MQKMQMITHPDAIFSDEKIYCFRYTFVAKKPKNFSFYAFGEARYKLYLNGKLISVGPCKGNASDMYYNSVETDENLLDGENTLEAVVLQLKNENHEKTVYANLCSVSRSGHLRFALKGKIDTAEGDIDIETDESWLVCKKEGISFVRDNANTVGMSEVAEKCYFYKENYVNAISAGDCVHYESLKRNPTQRGRYSLKPAPIPNQELSNIDISFDGEICDAKVYRTAFLKYVFSGKGKVKLTYSECRTMPGENRKADRTDSSGLLEGYCDVVEIDGDNVVYEPFWFKSFRFIKAEITGDVKIKRVCGIQTGYPLEVTGSFDCNDKNANKLWEISLRTLKSCMHETFEDCPYYEQLQYLMDSRLEILYGYQVSSDDRMTRRLLNDFASNQQSDGMLRSRTPDILPQIIPAYSLYYIFILFEHYKRFADLDLVKSYMSVSLNVLRYFSEHLSEKGLVKRSAFWDYVDWAEDWKTSDGSPLAEEREEITIYTFMYVTALKKAAFLLNELGDITGAELLAKKAENVFLSIKEYCFDGEKQLFADGPSKKYFSTHAQIWAVLSDCLDENTEKTIMKNSFALSTQTSYCYVYDYFRALEKCGLYDKRKTMLGELLKLVKLNCTTVPEKPINPRSECHAWNAVALYEFAASDLGVKVDEPNKTIYILPYINDFDCAEGKIATKGGTVFVKWQKQSDVLVLEIETPEGYNKEVYLSDKNIYTGNDTKITLKEKLYE